MSVSSHDASNAADLDGRDLDERSTASDCIVRGELENQEEVNRLSLSSFHLWGLGISIVIGGQYIGWNEMLQSGFGSALIATVLISSAYICLICCMAEVSSAIPFGGGSYGIARVTLGFFPGYIVAFMETCQNIIFVATAAVSFGQIISLTTGLSSGYEPLYWIFFYVSSLTLQICGGHTFWYMIMIMAIVSVALLLIYVFGTIPDFDFNENALFHREVELDRWFRDGGAQFMRILPLPGWMYLGVESINLACKDVPNPRVQVPRGYLSCIATLVAMSFAVLFCCCSVAPGITELMHAVDPLESQFIIIFKTTQTAATAIILPSIYAMCSGFMYCYGKQLKAMGKSGLVNHYFAHNYEGYKTPVNALIWGSLVSFVIVVIQYIVPALTDRHLFILCMLCAFTAYFSQFASFIIFRYKCSTIKREYVSPLGIAGAIYGFLVFALAFIGAVGFQRDFVAVSLFGALMVLIVAYYFWAAMDRQSFSEEEKQVMFRAYLIKSNEDRKLRIKKGKAAQVGCAIQASPSNVDKVAAAAKYQLTPFIDSPPPAPVAPETPSSLHEERDLFNVSDLGVVTSLAAGSPRAIVSHVSPHSARYPSQRVKLLVDTGSSRIAMTGQVESEELYHDAALQGVLQDNDDVLLIDEEAGRAEDGTNGVEIVTMTQSMLLSGSDKVYYDNSRAGEKNIEFSSIDGLDV